MRTLPAIAAVALLWLLAGEATAGPKDTKKKLDPKLAYLEISCLVEGARVLIDNAEVARTPLVEPLIVEPGKHTLKVMKPGYTEYADVFTATLGKNITVTVDLIPVAGYLRVGLAGEANKAPATAEATEVEEAQIYLDGKYLGDTPYEGEIAVGSHELEVRRLGSRDFRKDFEAVGGQEYSFDVELEVFQDELNPFIDKGRGATPPFWRRTSGKISLGVLATAILAGTIQVLSCQPGIRGGCTCVCDNPDAKIPVE